MDRKTIENQLRRDKCELLEGYVSEYLFERQFLAERCISKGWWVSERGGQRVACLLQAEPGELDRELATIIGQDAIVCHVWPAGYDYEARYFFADGTAGGTMTLEELLQQAGFTPLHEQGLPYEYSHTPRMNTCIDRLTTLGLAEGIYVTRHFVDDFLMRYFDNTVNIDFLIRGRAGGIYVSEVKFKDLMGDGQHFGLDLGPAALFRWLGTHGIRTYMSILYKSRDLRTRFAGGNCSIFQYLDTPDTPHVWYSTFFDEAMLGPQGLAPRRTSVDGRKLQKYVSIDKSWFMEKGQQVPLRVSL